MDTSIPQQETKYRHLQQIIAGLTEGILLIEPDQTLAWANEAALAMHGVQDFENSAGPLPSTGPASNSPTATSTACPRETIR